MMGAQPGRQSLLSLFFSPELRAWRGQMPLSVVFWGYGVAASLGLVGLHVSALGLGQLGVQQVLIILSLGYTVWILGAIWRCAPNADLFWATLARWLTFAWGLNSLFVLFFLQIDLMVRYVQA